MFYTKDNFLSKDECNHLINYFKNSSEKHLYEVNNTVVVRLCRPTTEDQWMDNLLQYIRTKCSAISDEEVVCDNIELVQWKPGTFMRPHKDKEDICSAIIYLNDDFSGGETVVRLNDSKGQLITVEPKQGKMLAFSNGTDNGYYHWVNTVKESCRYSLGFWFVPPSWMSRSQIVTK